MCCCGKPTINGEPGAYSWDGKSFSTRQPSPPTLNEGDELLYDGPGRCGRGVDSHCYHFRVVKHYGTRYLLVRHGGGEERIELGGSRPGIAPILGLAAEDTYWLLQTIYHTLSDHTRDAVRSAVADLRRQFTDAYLDGRIRKVRGQRAVKIELKETAAS